MAFSQTRSFNPQSWDELQKSRSRGSMWPSTPLQLSTSAQSNASPSQPVPAPPRRLRTLLPRPPSHQEPLPVLAPDPLESHRPNIRAKRSQPAGQHPGHLAAPKRRMLAPRPATPVPQEVRSNATCRLCGRDLQQEQRYHQCQECTGIYLCDNCIINKSSAHPFHQFTAISSGRCDGGGIDELPGPPVVRTSGQTSRQSPKVVCEELIELQRSLAAASPVVSDDEFESINPDDGSQPGHESKGPSPALIEHDEFEEDESEGDNDEFEGDNDEFEGDNDEFGIPSLPGTSDVRPDERPKHVWSPVDGGDDGFEATGGVGQPQVRLASSPSSPEDDEFESAQGTDHITEDEFEELGQGDRVSPRHATPTGEPACSFCRKELLGFRFDCYDCPKVFCVDCTPRHPKQHRTQMAFKTDALSPTTSENDRPRQVSSPPPRRNPRRALSSTRSLAPEGDISGRVRLRTGQGRRGRPRGKSYHSSTRASGGITRNQSDISGVDRLGEEATSQPLRPPTGQGRRGRPRGKSYHSSTRASGGKKRNQSDIRGEDRLGAASQPSSSDEDISDDATEVSPARRRQSLQPLDEVAAGVEDQSTAETADELASGSTGDGSPIRTSRRKSYRGATARGRPTEQPRSSAAASVPRETVITIRIPQGTLIDDEDKLKNDITEIVHQAASQNSSRQGSSGGPNLLLEFNINKACRRSRPNNRARGGGRPWDNGDRRQLQSMMQRGFGIEQAASELGRTVRAVYQQWWKQRHGL